MTTTTQQQPIPDTRYVKQGAPPGDFAGGERTKPPVPEIDDFASGEHTLPTTSLLPEILPAVSIRCQCLKTRPWWTP